MFKKLALTAVILSLMVFYGFSQDSEFNSIKFNHLIKGLGAAEYSGWGLNFDEALDPRPVSAAGGAFVMNHHRGLTFSAHSVYGGIRFYNQGYPVGPFEPSTGAKMVMSIANNAVGIRTTNPRALLDIGADISNQQLGAVFGRLIEGDNYGEGTFLGVRGFNTTNEFDRKSFALEHSFYGIVNNSINFFRGWGMEGGCIAFNTNINVERMRIDADGNVGIGTASPKEKLSVNGNIRAREIKVETSNWPDYVFEDNYVLKPLAEVASYIKINKRLPELPAANEVETEGLELGRINKLLVKKIEELTLYLIEKDTQLKDHNAKQHILESKLYQQEIELTKLQQSIEALLKNK